MFSIRSIAAMSALALALGLSACGKPQTAEQAAASATISGAGATFPGPLYTKWGEDYKATGGAELNYQAIGSGAGINQIKAKTVDFGASDKPMKPADLDANGLYQFPTVMGGVVPIISLAGVTSGQLKLTGDVLAKIYLGKITKWNDPAIKALNAGLTLPGSVIVVVHRAEGSGTSFLFTSYLAGANAEWATKVGGNDTVQWPVGVGAKGNDGVAAAVKQAPGSIGYVEYAYAEQNGLVTTQLKNKDGEFVSPTAEAFGAAAFKADWAHAAGNYILLLDQPGAESWPITGATFILMQKAQTDAKQAAVVLKFFDWAYKSGNADAASLDYVPLPQATKDMVRGQWAQIKGPDGAAVYTPTP